MAEPLDSRCITAALPRATRSWMKSLEVLEHVDSTNAYIMRAARAGSIDGLVVTAEFQTAGRGRRGRSWAGDPGRNVAVSIGHAVDLPLTKIGGLSLVVGLAVADVLDCLGVEGVGLKWPNDIMLGEAKLGGVLIELLGDAPPAQVIVGIGLNVELDERTRAAIGAPVAALADLGLQVDRNALIAALIARVHEFTTAFESSGFERFQPLWESLNVHAGRRVEVLNGDMRVSGRSLGVTATGELRIETDVGEVTFNAGEVSLRAVEARAS